MEEIKDIRLEDISGVSGLLQSMAGTGFQASVASEALEIIGEMKKSGATIFFAFTANMVASGMRGLIAELCKSKFVDAVVTTAGSIDHDIIKSQKPYYKGSFNSDDVELHRKGINRIGNIYVPTDRYELLENIVQGYLKEMFSENKALTPSGFCAFAGERLNEGSFLYWCAKNQIPVFCPGIIDGAIGLQMYFFKQANKEFMMDVTGDMKDLAGIVLNSKKTGGLILGGGISKHHIIGANIVRGGLDYAVYVTTASEYDGSLSGAQTREAKSWGKIKEKGKSTTVVGDASIIFPILVSGMRERGLI